MPKIKLRKNKKKVFIFIFILIVFVLLLFRNKEYEINYSLDNANIKESYDDEKKMYHYEIVVNEKKYVVDIQHKRLNQKKLIQTIEIKQDDLTTCIIPESKKLSFYPLCYEEDTLISYDQIKNKDLLPANYFKTEKSTEKEYNKIKIHALNDKTYYIWNYKGFYKINAEDQETISIFDQDIYNLPLASKSNQSILIADYNENYNFHTFYLLSLKNNKIKKITTKKELSFDSYIMGTYKNKVYLVDKKNKKEYEINTKKLTINDITKKNQGKIWRNHQFEEISINKISNQEYVFEQDNLYDYQLIEDKLYLVNGSLKTLVSNFSVKSIIEIDQDTVYYLVKDQLYSFNPYEGEVLIMSYFEWNFNYENMIYIF